MATWFYCANGHQLYRTDVDYQPGDTIRAQGLRQESYNPGEPPVIRDGQAWTCAGKVNEQGDLCGSSVFFASGDTINADTPLRRQGNRIILG